MEQWDFFETRFPDQYKLYVYCVVRLELPYNVLHLLKDLFFNKNILRQNIRFKLRDNFAPSNVPMVGETNYYFPQRNCTFVLYDYRRTFRIVQIPLRGKLTRFIWRKDCIIQYDIHIRRVDLFEFLRVLFSTLDGDQK